MGIFIKHIIRNMFVKKGKASLIISTLEIVAMFLSAILLVLLPLIFSFQEMIDVSQPADYVVKSTRSNLDYELIKRINSDFDALGLRTFENGYFKTKDSLYSISLTSFDMEKA